MRQWGKDCGMADRDLLRFLRAREWKIDASYKVSLHAVDPKQSRFTNPAERTKPREILHLKRREPLHCGLFDRNRICALVSA
jgi:hypothetical protein